MKPIVSVVILTYNQEKYISQAIESVLGQECSFPYEIVIADDCSSDQTRTICRNYAAEYPQIRLIENENNKGLLRNYVETLLACEGKYIADLAGDDYWIDKNKLQRQVAFLEANEDTVLIHSDWIKFNNSSYQTTGSGNVRSSGKEYTHTIVESTFIQSACPHVFLCTSTFRKDAFQKIYSKYPYFFDSEKWKCEDFQLTVLMAYEGYFYYEEKITTAYRISADSISNSSQYTKQYAFNKSVLELMIHLADVLNLQDVLIKRKIAERAELLILGAVRTSEYKTIKDVKILLKENNISVSFLSRSILKLLQNVSFFKGTSKTLNIARAIKHKLSNQS